MFCLPIMRCSSFVNSVAISRHLLKSTVSLFDRSNCHYFNYLTLPPITFSNVMAPKRKKAAVEVEDNSDEGQSGSDEGQSGSKKPCTDEFGSDAKTPDGNKWNFKIVSWNVSGLRAWLKKDGLSIFKHEDPDVVCLQETKCSDSKLPAECKQMKGFHSYFCSAQKEGYSGVALFSKIKPKAVTYGIGTKEHDDEGRCLTAEYENFFIVNAYVPNAGRKLVTLNKKMDWDVKLRKYLKDLDTKKAVIFCGDLNVAHLEIDLANPKTNTRSAGFTKEERDGFSDLLKEGFVDTFRKLYPDKKDQYTFWTYMMNARAKNVGWRLDYFVLSERLLPNLCDNIIRSSVMGSDHCPITLLMHISS